MLRQGILTNRQGGAGIHACVTANACGQTPADADDFGYQVLSGNPEESNSFTNSDWREVPVL
jgi:hypothetical protein